MKIFYALVAMLLMALPGIADQRDGSNGVPFLAPDLSLKTTDSFYLGSEAVINIIPLPPIFGGPMPTTSSGDPWMDQVTRGKNMSTNVTKITALSSYALTEEQMKNAKIPLGQESWL